MEGQGPDSAKVSVDYFSGLLPSGRFGVFANSVLVQLCDTHAEAEAHVRLLKHAASSK
jgi:hypothetical protein